MAESNELAVPHKTPELDRRVHLEELAQNKMVWDIGYLFRSVVVGRNVFNAIVVGVFEVVGDKVGALQQQINVARKSALHTVGSGDPGSILGSGPVQLGDDLASELSDGILDGTMNVAPLGRRVLLFIVILLSSSIRSREDARVAV